MNQTSNQSELWVMFIGSMDVKLDNIIGNGWTKTWTVLGLTGLNDLSISIFKTCTWDEVHVYCFVKNLLFIFWYLRRCRIFHVYNPSMQDHKLILYEVGCYHYKWAWIWYSIYEYSQFFCCWFLNFWFQVLCPLSNLVGCSLCLVGALH